MREVETIMHTREVELTKKTGRPKKRLGEYERICVVVPAKTKRQLESAAYMRTTPGHTCTLTQLIIELAQEETMRISQVRKA